LELALPLLRPAFIRELSLNLVPSLSSNDGLMLAFIAAAAVRNAAVNRKLRINAEEANTVRLLFDLYLRLGSVRQLQEECQRLGLRTKLRTMLDGGGLGEQRSAADTSTSFFPTQSTS
jgi:hypothetical protein